MTFYRYFGEEEIFDLPRPKRVYASIDSTEPDYGLGLEPETFYLDAIDADAFDRNEISNTSIKRGVLDKAASIIEIRNKNAKILQEKGIFSTPRRWYELRFDENGSDLPILHYLNLFGTPIERKASQPYSMSVKATATL